MNDNGTVLVINRNGFGQAEPALQIKMLQTYLKLLEESGILPSAICFYAEGVFLAITGSPVLPTLRSLESRGVRLILCSTCLMYYSLADKVEVGIVGGMADILEAQFKAVKVITL